MEVILHGTASNKNLQFVVAATWSGSGGTTTYPFVFRAQGRL